MSLFLFIIQLSKVFLFYGLYFILTLSATTVIIKKTQNKNLLNHLDLEPYLYSVVFYYLLFSFFFPFTTVYRNNKALAYISWISSMTTLISFCLLLYKKYAHNRKNYILSIVSFVNIRMIKYTFFIGIIMIGFCSYLGCNAHNNYVEKYKERKIKESQLPVIPDELFDDGYPKTLIYGKNNYVTQINALPEKPEADPESLYDPEIENEIHNYYWGVDDNGQFIKDYKEMMFGF